MKKVSKKRMKQQERKNAVLLLRFRTDQPAKNAVKYCSYQKIGRIVNLSYNEVQYICRRALNLATKRSKPKDTSRQLEQLHKDFLTNPRTLELWAGRTLKERCILFHRRFPNKRIAVTSLRVFYLRNKLRRKKVRAEKKMPQKTRAEFAHKCQDLLVDIEVAQKEGRRFVFLDELNFTKRSLQLREWAAKNSNLTVDQEEVYVGYRSCIVSMSADHGIGYYVIQPKAVKSDDFVPFLHGLRAYHGKTPLVLYCD